MRIRKILYFITLTLVALFTALWAVSLITGYTLVLLLNDPGLYITDVAVKKGETVRVLKDLNFEEGNWTAYLVLGNDDWVNSKDYDRNCYRVRDKAILNQFKNAWEMEITSGDVATVTSYIIFLKDGSPVWKAGVIINDDGLEGFQSSALGWVRPMKKGAIKDSLMLFDSVYAPIVIL